MMERKEGISFYRNIDGLGVIQSLAQSVVDSVKRIISPPEEEITNASKEVLENAIEKLKLELTASEYKELLHVIEDTYLSDSNGEIDISELMKNKILINVHFWVQVLRDKKLGSLGRKLKPFDVEEIAQEPLENNTAEWIIENRIENLPELEKQFLQWAEDNNIRELLEKGSLQIITNHDQWATQQLSLYFFQKYLGIPKEKSMTIMGLRIAAFKKFEFDPEEIARGQGHVYRTIPPTKNGRHESFDSTLIGSMGLSYLRKFTEFLKTKGNISTMAPTGTRDKFRQREGNNRDICPAHISDQVVKLLEKIQSKTTIIPLAFNHGNGFHLERTHEKFRVDLEWGSPIEQGGKLSGEEIWQKVLDIIPNYDSSLLKD